MPQILTRFVLAFAFTLSLLFFAGASRADIAPGSIQHVVVISIDGFHAVDLANYVASHPYSMLATLSRRAVTYTHASTPMPSDSLPGTVAMFTGGSPKTTGIFYDDAYDRHLLPPTGKGDTPGTEVFLDESLDKDSTRYDAGGGLDTSKFPRDPVTKAILWPHQMLRTNTVFEVIRAAGGWTSWSDKHPSYEILSGLSGMGIDDLFCPEINAGGSTKSLNRCEVYDDVKVWHVIAQINDHAPAIMGMNFQAINVAQKLPDVGGYIDAAGTPSAALSDAMDHTDASLSSIYTALSKQGLLSSTAFIITAKHGQAPIDYATRKIVDKTQLDDIVNGIQPNLLAHATCDDVALLWLSDAAQTDTVVAALKSHSDALSIKTILSGPSLAPKFNSALTDSRQPDIIVIPTPGVIYAAADATKRMEHGGFGHDDTNVALMVSAPGLNQAVEQSNVRIAQIAPTILALLGLDTLRLDAVREEGTTRLPGL